MSPLVLSAVLACLAAPSSFEDVPDRLGQLGFVEVSRNEFGAVRWAGSEGVDAFLSRTEQHLICSVWFDGGYQESTQEFDSWLADNNHDVPIEEDDMGVMWRVKEDRAIRLVYKQGNPNRLGLAIFVNRN